MPELVIPIRNQLIDLHGFRFTQPILRYQAFVLCTRKPREVGGSKCEAHPLLSLGHSWAL